MGAWGTSIFSDDMAMDIRREYSVLLSVGKSSEEAEKMLIKYYSSIMNCNDPDEDVFWFVLALCEWKKGRLSQFVKKKALDALEKDYEYLTAGGVFPEELIKNFIKAKRAEVKELSAIPHPADFDKYYNL